MEDWGKVRGDDVGGVQDVGAAAAAYPNAYGAALTENTFVPTLDSFAGPAVDASPSPFPLTYAN